MSLQKDEMGDRRQLRFQCSATRPQREMTTLGDVETITSFFHVMYSKWASLRILKNGVCFMVKTKKQ